MTDLLAFYVDFLHGMISLQDLSQPELQNLTSLIMLFIVETAAWDKRLF